MTVSLKKSPTEIHVSPSTGADTNPGTRECPLATIRAACDLARQAGKARRRRIVLHAGSYCQDQPLDLDSQDCGLTIEVAPDAKVILGGGREVTGRLTAGECSGGSGSGAPAPENHSSGESVRRDLRKASQRFGLVIGLRPERMEEYLRLHAPDNPGVRDLLRDAHMANFTLFLHRLDDGNYYEFGYFEYTGDDYESDMARLAAHPRNQQWLALCNPMQLPLRGHVSWAEMEEIYHND